MLIPGLCTKDTKASDILPTSVAMMGFGKDKKAQNSSFQVKIIISSVSMLLIFGGMAFIFWGQTVTSDSQLVQYGFLCVIFGIITFSMGLLCQSQTGKTPSGSRIS